MITFFLLTLSVSLMCPVSSLDDNKSETLDKEAKKGEFPWQALLWIEKHSLQWDGLILCGGALVAPDAILTTGGCLWAGNLPDIDRPVKVTGMLGRITLNGTNGREFNSDKFEVHEEFDPYDLIHNIALVYIPPVPLSDDIKPISIGQVATGDNVTISGWANAQGVVNDVLLYRDDLKVISKEECEKFSTRLQEDMVCTVTSVGDTGVNKGNGGGALVSGFPDKPLLVATPTFLTGKMTAHTLAENYKEWINEKIQNYRNSNKNKTDKN